MSKKEKSKEEKHNNESINSNHSGEHHVNKAEDSIEDISNESNGNDLEGKLKEQEEKYLRLYAEFDNYRRRSAKEKLELMQQAGSDILKQLLPVLDDFQRSLKAAEQNNEGLKEGIELVNRKFIGVLEGRGLKKMEAIGQEFDPEFHEAITQIPVSDDAQKGKVVDVVEEGYVLNEKVIRYAKVIIGA